MANLSRAFPITKFTKLDDGRLEIEGIATSEAEDSQGDVLTFDGSIKAMEKWMESGPNVREQHDPKKAVGRGIETWPIPDQKAVGVRVFVSKGAPDTQEKVMDGTLSMFSIGGDIKSAKPMKKHGKALRLVEEWECVELSLVDRGANPDARFEIVKGDHMSEQIAGAADETPKAEEPPATAPEPEVKKEDAPEEDVPEIGLCSKCNEKASMRLCQKCADDMAHPEEKAAGPEVKKDASAAWDIRAALDCLDWLRGLLSVEEGEVGEDPAQVESLKTAIRALSEFVASEAKELTEPEPEPMAVEMAALAETVKALDARFNTLSESLMTAPKPEPIEKALNPVAAQIGDIAKAVGDLTSLTDEVKAIREGVEIIKKQPVPGGPFVGKLSQINDRNPISNPSAVRSERAAALRRAAELVDWTNRDVLLREADRVEKE